MDVYEWFITNTKNIKVAALMQALLLFAYCFLFFFLKVTPSWQLGWHWPLPYTLTPTPTFRWNALMATTENSHKHLWGQGLLFFFPLFFSFLPPLPPSQTLYIPPAIMPSVSHLMAFPLLSLGGSVCAWAVFFVNSRWNPCCNSHVGAVLVY